MFWFAYAGLNVSGGYIAAGLGHLFLVSLVFRYRWVPWMVQKWDEWHLPREDPLVPPIGWPTDPEESE